MGVFGRVAPDASADYVAVMRFEPAAAKAAVKDLPTRLIDRRLSILRLVRLDLNVDRIANENVTCAPWGN